MCVCVWNMFLSLHTLYPLHTKYWRWPVSTLCVKCDRKIIHCDWNTSLDVSLCRSQRLRGLRRRSAAARLGSNPAGGMDVCLLWVLSRRGLCDELITHPQESYRLCCVVVCDLETSWLRRPWPTAGCRAKTNKQTNVSLCLVMNVYRFVHYYFFLHYAAVFGCICPLRFFSCGNGFTSAGWEQTDIRRVTSVVQCECNL